MVELRGGLVRDILEQLDSDTTPDGERIRQLVPPATRTFVEECSRTDWIDAEHMLNIDQALLDVLGEEGFVQYWTEFAGRGTDIPVLRPIFAATMRLLVSPWLVCKSLPRVYGAMVHGVGDMVLEKQGTRSAVFTINECDDFSRPNLFGLANLGGIQGGFALAQSKAEVSYEMIEDEHVTLRYPISW